MATTSHSKDKDGAEAAFRKPRGLEDPLGTPPHPQHASGWLQGLLPAQGQTSPSPEPSLQVNSVKSW